MAMEECERISTDFSNYFESKYNCMVRLQKQDYIFSDKEWQDDKTFYPGFMIGQMITLVVAMMLIIGYGALAFSGLMLPFVLQAIINGLFVGAFVLVLGVVYAIMNDMLACRHNIEYYTNGHAHWSQNRGLVKTKNPTTNAIAWGILASFGLALPAGIVFCITTICASFCGVVFPAYIMLFLAATIPLIVLLADLIGKYSVSKMPRYKIFQCFRNIYDEFPNGADLNDEIKKRKLTGKENKAARDRFLEAWTRRWVTNGERNLIGYILLPLLGLVALVLAVVFGKLHITIPHLVLSLPLKLGLGSIPVVFLLGCLIYLAVARAGFLNGGQKRFFSGRMSYKYGMSSDEQKKELNKSAGYIQNNVDKLVAFFHKKDDKAVRDFSKCSTSAQDLVQLLRNKKEGGQIEESKKIQDQVECVRQAWNQTRQVLIPSQDEALYRFFQQFLEENSEDFQELSPS